VPILARDYLIWTDQYSYLNAPRESDCQGTQPCGRVHVVRGLHGAGLVDCGSVHAEHFPVRKILVALCHWSIARRIKHRFFIWWQSFPSSDARRMWLTLSGTADAKTPSAGPGDHKADEPSPVPPAVPLIDEEVQPVAPIAESNPTPARPPSDPTSTPLAGQMSRDRLSRPTYLVASVRPAVVCIQTGSGSGSGFIINQYGTIVTNRHVVGRHPRVMVRLDDGRRVCGQVSRFHPAPDIAIARITAPHLQSFPLTDAHRVPVGAEVTAFGFPLDSSIGPAITVT